MKLTKEETLAIVNAFENLESLQEVIRKCGEVLVEQPFAYPHFCLIFYCDGSGSLAYLGDDVIVFDPNMVVNYEEASYVSKYGIQKQEF